MPEREPRATVGIGKVSEFLFGHGRRFGIQRGSVSERIEDPYYGDTRLLSLLSRNGQRVPEYEVSKEEESWMIDRIVKQINKGTASYDNFGLPDKDLIAFMNHELNLTGLSLAINKEDELPQHMWVSVPSNLATMTDDEIKEKLNSTPLSIYQEILSRSRTTRSLMYLKDLFSSVGDYFWRQRFGFAYRGETVGERLIEAYEIGKFVEQYTDRDNFHDYSVYALDKVTYRAIEFEVIFPFAQAAISALEQMAKNQADSEYTRMDAQKIIDRYQNTLLFHKPAQFRVQQISREETDRETSRRVI